MLTPPTALKDKCPPGKRDNAPEGQKPCIEVTSMCLPRKDCAASELIRTKNPVSRKGKRSSEQQRLNLTETPHSRDWQSLFQMILRKRQWTLAVPWCLAHEAAVRHGRAAHSEVLVPDFPLNLDFHHRSSRFKKNKQPVTDLLSALCVLLLHQRNTAFHYRCTAEISISTKATTASTRFGMKDQHPHSFQQPWEERPELLTPRAPCCSEGG